MATRVPEATGIGANVRTGVMLALVTTELESSMLVSPTIEIDRCGRDWAQTFPRVQYRFAQKAVLPRSAESAPCGTRKRSAALYSHTALSALRLRGFGCLWFVALSEKILRERSSRVSGSNSLVESALDTLTPAAAGMRRVDC